MPARLPLAPYVVAWNGLIALAALLAIYFAMQGPPTAYVIAKGATTALVILLVVLFGHPADRPFRAWMVAALMSCLAGDLLLTAENGFLAGLSAFFVAHVLFLLAFRHRGGFIIDLWPLLFLLAYGFGLYILLWPGLGALALPVLVYTLVITVMSWQGIALYRQERSVYRRWIAAGVVFFLVSDSLLAIDLFKAPLPYAPVLILSTYWAAIGLLANASRSDRREVADRPVTAPPRKADLRRGTGRP